MLTINKYIEATSFSELILKTTFCRQHAKRPTVPPLFLTVGKIILASEQATWHTMQTCLDYVKWAWCHLNRPGPSKDGLCISVCVCVCLFVCLFVSVCGSVKRLQSPRCCNRTRLDDFQFPADNKMLHGHGILQAVKYSSEFLGNSCRVLVNFFLEEPTTYFKVPASSTLRFNSNTRLKTQNSWSLHNLVLQILIHAPCLTREGDKSDTWVLEWNNCWHLNSGRGGGGGGGGVGGGDWRH